MDFYWLHHPLDVVCSEFVNFRTIQNSFEKWYNVISQEKKQLKNLTNRNTLFIQIQLFMTLYPF